MNPKFKGVKVFGKDLRNSSIKGLDLTEFIAAYKTLTAAGEVFFERAEFMDKLAGTDKLRLAIEAGQSQQQIKQSWQKSLARFKKQRKPYLLYQ